MQEPGLRRAFYFSLAFHAMAFLGIVAYYHDARSKNLIGEKGLPAAAADPSAGPISVDLVSAPPPVAEPLPPPPKAEPTPEPTPPPRVEKPEPTPPPETPAPTPQPVKETAPKELKIAPKNTPKPTPTPRKETPKPTATPKDEPKPEPRKPKETATPTPRAMRTPTPTPKIEGAISPDAARKLRPESGDVTAWEKARESKSTAKSASAPSSAALAPSAGDKGGPTAGSALAKASNSGVGGNGRGAPGPFQTGGNGLGYGTATIGSSKLTGVGLPDYYARQALAHIRRHFRVPPDLQSSKTAVVAFTIRRDGSLTNVEIEDSSGSAELDQLALSAFRSARQVAPLPDSVEDDSISAEVTVSFQN